MTFIRTRTPRAASTPSGCPSPPTGSSRPRRGCSPPPRACTTPASTAARCSMAPPASGASMPATAGARSPTPSSASCPLDYAPSFQMGHPLAFDFAERLAEIALPTRRSTASSSPTPVPNRSIPRSRSPSPTSAPIGQGDAHAPHRSRARLSWRRLRRHVGRRHGQQPPRLRAASSRRRPSAPHP